MLDIGRIMEVLPHRYPFLLVDRIVELEPERRVVAIKNVTINEPFFVGHFPGHPIMPGVLIVEAMAQAGGVLVMDRVPDPASKVVATVSWDLAEIATLNPESAYQRVELAGGKVGFIATDKLRSLIDYRLTASSRNGRWHIISFVAGD